MKCIEEVFYKPPGDLSLVHKMIEIDTRIGIDENSLRQWIGKYPNIYTFSKSIAEELVRQHSQTASHACGIYRPSIVVSTLEEPFAGWNNGLSAILVIFLLYGLGIIHVGQHYCYPIDLIPCDMSINVLLAMTWDLKDRWTRIHQKEAIIYNYGSSCVNPTSLKFLSDSNKNVEGTIRSRYAFFHLIPAYVADVALVLTGRKRKAVDMYHKVHKHMDKIDYWGNGNWRIHMKNSLEVVDRLNSTDRELFFCDLKQLDWSEWCLRLWKGTILYHLREEIPNEKGRRRYILLCIMYYGIISCFCLAILHFTIKIIT
ncbi:hypothetical protein QAD02_023814 [Eretmocerus hayati]|uniref:Uncharacterized protein n=1 Tax=Eretmocerus hayati TaxID=131215 RepID=A0ACC2PXM1_9HYME|nr:hypothetical protein QAD02_023814 [Eretmocerus hayati]